MKESATSKHKPNAALLKVIDMPKTFNNIYDEIISLEKLYWAHKQVQKGKRRNDVAAYARDHVEEIIDNLHNDLVNMTFQSDPYRRFVTRKEVKRRRIDEPSFRDRILHHSIVESKSGGGNHCNGRLGWRQIY